MRLLPRESIVRTGPVDHADWNYRGVRGYIQRRRFHLALRLLAGRCYARLLEIGYGSGVFLPELAAHCDQLFGVDIHPHVDAVADAVGRIATRPRLTTGSATELPFDSQYFDAVVAVSTMEFVDDPAAACREIGRVLRPGGSFVVITPGHSALVDFGLWLLTGESAKADYGNRRQTLIAALLAHFDLVKRQTYPRLGLPGMVLYQALKLRPRRIEGEGI